MTKKEQIENILAALIQKIQSVDCDQKANKIVKDLDKLTFQCYQDLFAVFDSRDSVIQIKDEKRGHCC